MLRRSLALGVVVLAAALLAGCGSSNSNSKNSNANSSNSESAPASNGNGIAAKSPKEIVEAAVSAASSAHSVHLAGAVNSDGHAAKLNVSVLTSKSLEGEFSQENYTFKIIVIGGNAYINGTSALEHFGNPAFTKLLNGRWLEVPANNSEFASFAQFTKVSSLFKKLNTEHGTLSKGAETTINGEKAIAVTDTTKGGTLYVATTGAAYPLEVTGAKTDPGTLTFSDWNASSKIVAPTNAVSLAELTSSASH